MDTTGLADGVHTITAEAGGKTVTASVTVDNTVPSVEIGIDEDEDVTGTLVIDPQVSDEGGVSEVSAILDGTEIELSLIHILSEPETENHPDFPSTCEWYSWSGDKAAPESPANRNRDGPELLPAFNWNLFGAY